MVAIEERGKMRKGVEIKNDMGEDRNFIRSASHIRPSEPCQYLPKPGNQLVVSGMA